MTHRVLYARVLGDDFERLPPMVRAIHDVLGDGFATGHASVTRATNVFARLAGALVRLPPAGDYSLRVHFEQRDGSERWTRDFSGHRMCSTLSAQGRHLVERFGPLVFVFQLDLLADALSMTLVRWSVFGVPMPAALGPQSRTREWQEQRRYRFDVQISLPWIGDIIGYRGWLETSSGEPL